MAWSTGKFWSFSSFCVVEYNLLSSLPCRTRQVHAPNASGTNKGVIEYVIHVHRWYITEPVHNLTDILLNPMATVRFVIPTNSECSDPAAGLAVREQLEWVGQWIKTNDVAPVTIDISHAVSDMLSGGDMFAMVANLPQPHPVCFNLVGASEELLKLREQDKRWISVVCRCPNHNGQSCLWCKSIFDSWDSCYWSRKEGEAKNAVAIQRMFSLNTESTPEPVFIRRRGFSTPPP